MLDPLVRPGDSGITTDPARVDETSRRPIRLIGLLLLLQAAGLAGAVAYELPLVDWRRLGPELPSAQAFGAASSLLFVPPAALALLAAMGFLFLARTGWLLAAISQGMILAICLWLYSQAAPFYIYPIMVYSVLMVLYLNSHHVRVVFHAGRDGAGEVPEAARGD